MEAAFLLPVLCVLVLLLVQPGILLYDRMVMEGAAADACRLLATTSNSREGAQEQCEAYVRRRLGAVPQQDCFHVHGPQCTWDIRLEGDEASQSVRVSIATEARPLPLLGTAASLLGIVNGRAISWWRFRLPSRCSRRGWGIPQQGATLRPGLERGSMKRDLFREDDGFSTVGMVVALLVTLSLLFSAARVYRVSSASADIQNVADAAALAPKTKWPNSWWRCALATP